AHARLPRRDRRRRPRPQGVRGRPRRIDDGHRRPDRRKALTMAITPTEKIWMNGRLVAWDAARIHVLTHTLHYGTGVFEGIRCYETSPGPAVFRLTDHIERLHASAKILMMPLPYSVEELVEACKDTVRANGLPSCYVRPIAYYGYGEMGVSPLHSTVDV